MKAKEMAIKALAGNDAKLALQLTSALRDGKLTLKGRPVLFNYNDVIDFVVRATGKTREEVEPAWEGLLAEADK